MGEFTLDEIKRILRGDDVVGGSAAVWLHATSRNIEVDFDTTESDIDVYTTNLARLQQQSVKMNGRTIEYVDMRYLGSKFEPVDVLGVSVPSVRKLLQLYRSVKIDFEEDRYLHGEGYEKKLTDMEKKIALLERMDDDKENDSIGFGMGGRTLRF